MISATAAAGAAPVFRPHCRARRGGEPVLQNPEAATAPYAVETSRATHVSCNCGRGHVWLFFYRPPNQAAHARQDWHRNKRFAVTRSYIAFLKQKRKKILPFSISGTACRSFPKRLGLNGQTLTAFGAARSQYGTAAAGFGAHQKAVGAFAFGYGRLISAFHDIPKNRYEIENGRLQPKFLFLSINIRKLNRISRLRPRFRPHRQHMAGIMDFLYNPAIFGRTFFSRPI